ncbi:hypothetical protein COOONC_13544 [Cooperia oncophora]
MQSGERDTILVTFTREEMAARDWRIFNSLSLEDKPIFISRLQWQRVVNMGMFMDANHVRNNTTEYSLLSADLTRRGIDAFKTNWRLDDPLPLLPGYSAKDFPPFRSFTAENISIEEEFISVSRMCAQIRDEQLHRSAKRLGGIQNPKESSTAEESVGDFKKLPPLKLRLDIRFDHHSCNVALATVFSPDLFLSFTY